MTLSFQHNVRGRSVYADGTVAAAKFLARQVSSGAGGHPRPPPPPRGAAQRARLLAL